MPSKKTTKKPVVKKITTKKKSPKKPPTKTKGENVAGMIIEQLNNIQAKLNDLNKRVINLESINVKPMEVSNRFSKIESRLGL